MSETCLPDKYDIEGANQGELMPYDVLKKYLIYSKRHYKPRLGKIDQDKLI